MEKLRNYLIGTTENIETAMHQPPALKNNLLEASIALIFSSTEMFLATQLIADNPLIGLPLYLDGGCRIINALFSKEHVQYTGLVGTVRELWQNGRE